MATPRIAGSCPNRSHSFDQWWLLQWSQGTFLFMIVEGAVMTHETQDAFAWFETVC